MNTISQSLLPSSPIRNIPVRYSTRQQADGTARLLEACNQSYMGVATKQYADGKVEMIAFATPGEVFVISVEADNRPGLLPSDQSFGLLLLSTAGILVGFDMGKLALRLHRDLKLPTRGIDLSTLFAQNTRDPWRPSKFIGTKVSPLVNKFEVDNLWNSASEQGSRNVCLRAWLAACAADACAASNFENTLKVDTRSVSDMELACLGELLRQTDVLEAGRPSESPNDFNQAKLLKDGNISLHNARYKNRVRRSHQTSVILTNADGREFVGRARGAAGKTTTIKLTDQSFSGNVQTVRVVGRQDPTNSERARDEFLLHILQGKKTLRNSTFIRRLWFPSHRKHRSGNRIQAPPGPLYIPDLNDSQVEAVSAMVSEDPLVIVHGPPGTGKTTTISAATAIWLRNRVSTWVVAHSNVAVKNIAEKLHKRDVNFRILVSKEFYVEWHEHIYEIIQENLIRSDELPEDPSALKRSLGDTCIMLSTLSTLSNPTLDAKGIFGFVPVVQLVIDEASQINLFEFMHLFEKCKDLKKVCFFGDPQQLPPYGKDNVPELQTIFDVEHLHAKAKFLNVQYRMPVPLGQFISLHVYDGKLETQHELNDRSCLSFVDASNGEELKSGFSWKNLQEIQIVVHLVRSYYKHTNFCVITPYDAQRAAIEGQLKSENLPWERVFNVDSFQGNEADYVLISVVRSSKPGFLTSLNRMNVMLTRCRSGLVIVTKSSFLQHGGRHTLLGRIAQHWEEMREPGETWVDWRLVAEGKVDLPGSPGPRRELRAPLGQVSRCVSEFAMNTYPRHPFLPPTLPNANVLWPGASGLLVPPVDQGAVATYADVLRFPSVAASQQDIPPYLQPHFPETSSPRTTYEEMSPGGVAAFMDVPRFSWGAVTVPQQYAPYLQHYPPKTPPTPYRETFSRGVATFPDAPRFSWGDIAVPHQYAPPNLQPRLPKTSEPRTSYEETFPGAVPTFTNGSKFFWGDIAASPPRTSIPTHRHTAISEQSSKYEAREQTTYESGFPSLPASVPYRAQDPPTSPQHPSWRKKVDQKTSVPTETPVARGEPQITSNPAPVQIPSPVLSPTVETISPRVIRIIPKNPSTDATDVGKAVKNKQKAAEGEQKVVENKQKTTEDKQRVAENRQKAVENMQKVVNMQKAVENMQKAVGNKQKAARNKQKPGEDKQKVGNKQKVAENKQKVAGNKKAAENKQKAAGSKQKGNMNRKSSSK